MPKNFKEALPEIEAAIDKALTNDTKDLLAMCKEKPAWLQAWLEHQRLTINISQMKAELITCTMVAALSGLE